MDEWIQSRRQCTNNYVLFVSVEVVIAVGRYGMHFHVVCKVLIVLKEIVVVFIVLRDCVWGLGMVHRFVWEMTIVYEKAEFG